MWGKDGGCLEASFHIVGQFPRIWFVWGLSVFLCKLMFHHICLGCLAFEPLPQLRLQMTVIESCKCARLGPVNIQMPNLLGMTP